MIEFLTAYAAFAVLGCVLGLAAIQHVWSALKRKPADQRVMQELEDAMRRKDVTGLRRIRLIHERELVKVDKNLPQRVDTFVDELCIEQHDIDRLKENKNER